MNRQVTRRQFLPLALMSFAASSLAVQPQKAAIREDYQDFNSGEIPDLQALGTNPAVKKEVEVGDRILAEAPKSVPLDIYAYLETRPDKNDDNEAYNGGWRDRWNPLIVRLFEQTKTKPSGDTTPWCAACLNWTLARVGLRTTVSASSGSFRNAPGTTDHPQPGDIVVFVARNPQEAAVGRGHVGLFIDRTGDEIVVLGGNQKNEFGHHSVCRRPFRVKGKSLDLHSFHAIDAFTLKH